MCGGWQADLATHRATLTLAERWQHKLKKEKRAFVQRGNLPNSPSRKTVSTPPPIGGVSHTQQVLTALVWAWWAAAGPLCWWAGSAGPRLEGSPVPPGLVEVEGEEEAGETAWRSWASCSVKACCCSWVGLPGTTGPPP